MKDHKDSFPNKVPCRLINPVKSNLGLVSKHIVEKINEKVRSCCNLNQGKNSHVVIDRKLTAVYKRNSSIGLYRDDGLAAFEGIGPRTADKIRKNFSAIFNETGLNITVQAHPKVENYLDITLDLNSGKYYPYRKPNSPPSTSTRCPTVPHQSLNSCPMPSTTDCPACLAIDLNLKKQRPSTKTL